MQVTCGTEEADAILRAPDHMDEILVRMRGLAPEL